MAESKFSGPEWQFTDVKCWTSESLGGTNFNADATATTDKGVFKFKTFENPKDGGIYAGIMQQDSGDGYAGSWDAKGNDDGAVPNIIGNPTQAAPSQETLLSNAKRLLGMCKAKPSV